MQPVIIKTFAPPKINRSEILRYLGVKEEYDDIKLVIDDCLNELNGKLLYKVCYSVFDITLTDATIIEGVRFESKNLLQNLNNCNSVVLFGATIGVGIDRLIQKYGALSPLKGVVLQAIGAERIESLCNDFCEFIKTEFSLKSLKPRFSAGYGDFNISYQKEIFNLLNLSKNIGLTLNDSLIMSPTKSVTAIIGLSDTACKDTVSCNACEKLDCLFRR